MLYGNGADDILYHIFLAVRESEQSFALSLAPSYFDYKTFALAVGLKVRFLDLEPDFSFDTYEYIRRASDPNCRLAILCNPNNPTGNLFSKEQLRQIITALPDKLVLIDETYYEFSGCTFAEELAQYPNLILVRSFSKAFSSAGLRFWLCRISPVQHCGTEKGLHHLSSEHPQFGFRAYNIGEQAAVLGSGEGHPETEGRLVSENARYQGDRGIFLGHQFPYFHHRGAEP